MPPILIVLTILALAGIAARVITQVAKTIAGRGVSPSELARIKQELEHHAAELEDAHSTLANQSTQLAELQERIDFAERLLATARDRPGLGPGETGG